MKILFSAYYTPNFTFLYDYIERALAGMGHTINIHDYYKTIIPGRIRDRVPFLDSWDMDRINRNLIRQAEKFKPELILVGGAISIRPETISYIRKSTGATTVKWIADYPRYFDFFQKIGPYYDHFFTTSSVALEQYGKAGNKNGHWLPFAFDPGIHKPVRLSEEEIKKYGSDICFVGSMYQERIEVLESLCDFDLGIWGIGWEKLPKESPLKRFVRGTTVGPEEWVKIFNASRISLNIVTNFLHLNPDKKELGFANMRVFEILGCGAFQLVDNKKDVLDLFTPGEHLAAYKDINDLRGLAAYYLKNEGERKRIAEEGRRIAIEKHTYRHRLEEMFEVIGAAERAR